MQVNITVGQICLANSNRDESNQTYRYGNRHNKFINMFKQFGNSDNKPAVLCIKELRQCMNSTGDKKLAPVNIVSDFMTSGNYSLALLENTKVHSTVKCDVYKPFYLAQLYDHEKYEKINSYCFRYYQDVFGNGDPHTPPHMGGTLVAGLYAPRDENGVPQLDKQFLVESVHFPLGDKDKLNVCIWLCSEYVERRNTVFGNVFDKVPIIRTGDFNLFQDDKLHDDHLRILGTYFTDVSSKTLVDENGNRMYGTFYPFPHDKPPNGIIIAKPYENSPNTSLLDYWYQSKESVGVLEHLSSCVYTSTFNSDNTDERVSYNSNILPLSDHLPLLCTFKY